MGAGRQLPLSWGRQYLKIPMRPLIAAFLLLIFLPANAMAANVPREAPEWQVSDWINGAPAKLKDFQGRVVIIDFFQLWCPGCNQFSIPLLKHWEQVFADEIANGKLEVVSIHTVFEGHDYQNNTRLRKFLKRTDIHHLVGIDRQKPGNFLPETMRIYGTRGTPEMAFIDKRGQVRFQNFGGFEVKPAEKLLRQLLGENPGS